MRQAAQVKLRIIARHKWVAGAVITESVNDNNYRRFTATIRGWKSWLIWEGYLPFPAAETVRDKVTELRDRIDQGDEAVFSIRRDAAVLTFPTPEARVRG